MYQVNFEYEGIERLGNSLAGLRDRVGSEPHPPVVFHIYTNSGDETEVEPVIEKVREAFPEALYVGCSANANIVNGRITQNDALSIAIACLVFEDPGTRVEVLSLPFKHDSQEEVAERFAAEVSSRPWVKAIELICPISDVHTSDFCSDISGIPEGIVLFGGGALSAGSGPQGPPPFVFSSENAPDSQAFAAVLYGGEPLRATARAITGWKPLGLPLKITKAAGLMLFELNGEPAYENYHRHLKIKRDADFFTNSLLFPLAIDHGGKTILRASLFAGDDGSLMLTSDLSAKDRTCRFAYGDPATILQSVGDCARELRGFAPQGLLVFSCASRLIYWGPDYVNRETEPFEALAPAAGLFTSAEFLRSGKEVLHHNVALVIAALREGDPEAPADVEIAVDDSEFNQQMQIINCLASFVGTASEELEEAYAQMAVAARTDGLTGIADRREMDRMIAEAIAQHEEPAGGYDGDEELAEVAGLYAVAPSVIMLDIDDFKKVNDTFGHRAGDEVLKGLSRQMQEMVGSLTQTGITGRWGGEEFMVLLAHEDIDAAETLAERIRLAFSSLDFPMSGRHTVSLGVAQLHPGETADALCMRVDEALYRAKAAGKDRVVVDR